MLTNWASFNFNTTSPSLISDEWFQAWSETKKANWLHAFQRIPLLAKNGFQNLISQHWKHERELDFDLMGIIIINAARHSSKGSKSNPI